MDPDLPTPANPEDSSELPTAIGSGDELTTPTHTGDSFADQPTVIEPVPSVSTLAETLQEAPLQSAPTSVTGKRLGPFTVVRELGRGAMGVVYEATHDDGRRVALKVLIAGSVATPKQRKRFEREARAMARLQHPAVVSVVDSGESDGLPYLALEFVEGRELEQLLDRLPLDELVRVIAQAARGLGHAHKNGILHRDVKPANIMVRDEDDQPLVTDFGLAREHDRSSSLTKTGQGVGTPYYMAPEQIASRAEPTAATDVYALGVVLYEGLTGKHPFHGHDHSAVQLYAAITAIEPDPPGSINHRIPADLDAVCMRAIAKDPSARYADGDAFAEALEAYLTKPQGSATAPAASTPATTRPAAKSPAAALLGMAACGLIALGGAGGLGLWATGALDPQVADVGADGDSNPGSNPSNAGADTTPVEGPSTKTPSDGAEPVTEEPPEPDAPVGEPPPEDPQPSTEESTPEPEPKGSPPPEPKPVASAENQVDIESYRTGPNSYRITRSLWVPSGKTLIIPAGSRVVMAPSARISCSGHLQAVGTREQPIVFTGEGWAGLQFTRRSSTDTPTGSLEWVVVENVAKRGRWGSGIYAKQSQVTFTDVHLRNCEDRGLAVYYTPSLTLTRVTCTGNGTDGAHFLGVAKVRLEDCRFADNKGPGLRVSGEDSDTLDVTVRATFSGNQGPGLQVQFRTGGILRLEAGTVFLRNQARREGGGLNAVNPWAEVLPEVVCTGVRFEDNTSRETGAAAYLDGVSATFRDVVFRANRVREGATLMVVAERGTAALDLSGCRFEGTVPPKGESAEEVRELWVGSGVTFDKSTAAASGLSEARVYVED